MHNHRDAERSQMKGLTLYPHNSLAQVYFEFGALGLLLFCSILFIGVRNARYLLARYKNEPGIRSLVTAVAAYFAFSFLLSLKQSTFLAAIGFYLSGSMLCALIQLSKTDSSEDRDTRDTVAREWA